VRRYLRGGALFWVAALGNLLMSQFNQVILGDQLRGEALGFYNLAFQIVILIRLLQTQLVRIMAPRIAALTSPTRDDDAAALSALARLTGLSLALTLPLVGVVHVVAPWVVRTLVGPEYLPSIPILDILLVWVALYGPAVVVNQFLVGLKMSQAYVLTSVSMGVLALVLSVAWIPTWGGVGAALALLSAHGLSIVGQTILVVHRLARSS